ncbi:Bone morphogenetic protein 7 like protein [Argiope bruennichi]|uniref:Bone morphogenetic protein 7 like protein n=1 Tax=Argiope bruennichi TaxID=94029 RepID=A0A8T0EWX7_ARGBR|nr:Bone morphogenetic protein 7 like protein [Argiope bruennichi]
MNERKTTTFNFLKMKNKKIFFALLAVCYIGDSAEDAQWETVLPSFFKRKYRAWSTNDTCNYERLKSLSTNVSQVWIDDETVHSAKARPAINHHDVRKVEFRLEFPRLSRKNIANLVKRRIVADIIPKGNKRDRFNVTALTVFVNENILELTFDVTTLYETSKVDFLDDINFNFRIVRLNGKTVKLLMRKNPKGFIILYESVETCNFMEFLHHDGRFGRSQVFHRMKNIPRNDLKSAPFLPDSRLCELNDFSISFMDIGLNWIIFPEVANIGICEGICSINSVKTGYRLLQNAFYYKANKGQPSSCRPSKFGSMTIIYIDYSDEMPVIAKFTGMIVKQCSCM